MNVPTNTTFPYALKVTTHTHTHTTILLLFWNMSGTTRVSRYQKGKTRKVKANLDLLEQEIVSGSGICWAIWKSAPHPRQPCQHPTTQFFTGQMPFLPPNQQRQSTEDKLKVKLKLTTALLNYIEVTSAVTSSLTPPGLCLRTNCATPILRHPE